MQNSTPYRFLTCSVGLLVLQEVADFGEEFLLGGAGGSGRLLGLRLFLALQLVDALDDQEDRKGDDEEVEHHLQEVAPIEREGRLHHLARFVDFLGDDGPLPVGEVEATRDGADERHDDVGHQRGHDFAESAADDHTDSHVHDVALHGKLLEFLNKLTHDVELLIVEL